MHEMPQEKEKADKESQAEKFKNAARQAQADEDEEAFKRRLKRVAGIKPEHEKT
jgi:hypothetical protein